MYYVHGIVTYLSYHISYVILFDKSENDHNNNMKIQIKSLRLLIRYYYLFYLA